MMRAEPRVKISSPIVLPRLTTVFDIACQPLGGLWPARNALVTARAVEHETPEAVRLFSAPWPWS
jgi:hypothetical protein